MAEADIGMTAADVEEGYSDVVAELTKAAARFAVQRRTLIRHVQGEEERFWTRHAKLLEEDAARAAAERQEAPADEGGDPE